MFALLFRGVLNLEGEGGEGDEEEKKKQEEFVFIKWLFQGGF